ncbi:ester cyclase [Bradyrhizobium sp. RDM12]
MSEDNQMRDLFDRWEEVWHGGKFDLVPSCIEDNYIRHNEKGTRVVTREDYAAEVATIRKEKPDFRTVVYDHWFVGNRAWFRFSFKWTDPETGKSQSQSGIQTYRAVNGRLAETWQAMHPIGSDWPDTTAQERWTSPSPIK